MLLIYNIEVIYLIPVSCTLTVCSQEADGILPSLPQAFSCFKCIIIIACHLIAALIAANHCLFALNAET